MDSINNALLSLIQKHESSDKILWILDENADLSEKTLDFPAAEKCTVITNRYTLNPPTFIGTFHFSDYDFSPLEKHSFDAIYFRVSKEKAVTHHVLNHVIQLCKPSGTIHVAGKKNEGTKTYLDKLKKLAKCSTRIKKDGDKYFGSVNPPQTENSTIAEKVFDDSDYSSLREVTSFYGQSIYSKPGVFGWKKLDDGTALLCETIQKSQLDVKDKNVFDLGCGSGYLGVFALSKGANFVESTDNNAGSLRVTEKNLESYKGKYQVIAADAGRSNGKSLHNGRFDLVLCNPPFHKGFDTSRDITALFLESAYNKCSKTGEAWFVVNCFVGIEKHAKKAFGSVQTVENNGSFKVIRCSQPR